MSSRWDVRASSAPASGRRAREGCLCRTARDKAAAGYLQSRPRGAQRVAHLVEVQLPVGTMGYDMVAILCVRVRCCGHDDG